MDYIFASITGIFFSILCGLMLFILTQKAQKGVEKNKVYFLPCFSSPLIFISSVSLIRRIQVYEGYLYYLLIGTILCVLLTVTDYAMLRYFDRTYLENCFPVNTVHIQAPWYYLVISAMVSAVAITVLLGWVACVCLSFMK